MPVKCGDVKQYSRLEGFVVVIWIWLEGRLGEVPHSIKSGGFAVDIVLDYFRGSFDVMLYKPQFSSVPYLN